MFFDEDFRETINSTAPNTSAKKSSAAVVGSESEVLD